MLDTLVLDVWDYLFFACLFLLVISGLAFLMFLLALPGKIALDRNHPDAEAVNLMGWVGFLAVVPWMNALIWAYKPTDKVDIRRLPKAEAVATEEMLAKMREFRKPGRPKKEHPKPDPKPAESDPAGGEGV
jgi:hypothetical protein